MAQQPTVWLSVTPQDHFALLFHAAVVRLIEGATRAYGSRAELFERFPFLEGYHEELHGSAEAELDAEAGEGRWRLTLAAWELAGDAHLPLRSLRRRAGLGDAELLLLLAAGAVEEDARFGLLFEELHGAAGQRRPTLGLLSTWWPGDPSAVRASLRRLHSLGLLDVLNADAPRGEWVLQPPALIWDALCGDPPATPPPWLAYHAPDTLTPRAELILPAALQPTLAALPDLLARGEAQAVIVRGPQHNGRRTLLGSLAREQGRGLLVVSAAGGLLDPQHWRQVGPLATLLGAMPVLALDPGPGETCLIPPLLTYDGPLGVVIGRQGGVSGPAVERAISLSLPLPDEAARRCHWRAGLGPGSGGGPPAATLDRLAERFRMTGGNIRRCAGLAQAYAVLAGRPAIDLADARQAARALNRQALDTLAAPLPAHGDWGQLALAAETMAELRSLERRCRLRERLSDAVGSALAGQITMGVRALFSGPSGAGKTLAAQILAGALGVDLYRLDLSAVVNKYIGETEKNLSQVFARAEELDVVLLLDEGDALLTQRTSVQSSNDRYANLETNYLLQRLEQFEGILLVTTNAPGRIDGAFQRRMDVVVTFHPPGPAEREAIWQLHLPECHTVPALFLAELAHSCALSGGQIRNAVLHAALLARDEGGSITADQLEAATRREYRKIGELCPLRSGAPASAWR